MTLIEAKEAARNGYVVLEEYAVDHGLGMLVPWAFAETLRALAALGAAYREGTLSDDEFTRMRAALRQRMGLE